MKVEVKTNTPSWCNCDKIWKISWIINGKRTYLFSTRGKRIGEIVSSEQKALEHTEALCRQNIIKEYLEGNIDRKEAVSQFGGLKFLSPRRPVAHLCTMLEYLIGRR